MPRDGRFVEILGYYNPIEKPARVKIFEDKMTHWLNEGAIPSDTVINLLKQVGFLKKYETMKKGGDVSGLTVAETIVERPKKRKSKKTAKAEA
jgi:ribosomal protein S16